MSMNDGFSGDQTAWLRCYRCWSQRLEAQVHYDAILKVDPESGEQVWVPAEGGPALSAEEWAHAGDDEPEAKAEAAPEAEAEEPEATEPEVGPEAEAEPVAEEPESAPEAEPAE